MTLHADPHRMPTFVDNHDTERNGSTLTDLPYQLCWETSRLQPGEAGILTNFSGGHHAIAVGQGTPAEQAAALTAQLEAIYPGIGATRAGMREVRFHWPSHPWTRGNFIDSLAAGYAAQVLHGAHGELLGYFIAMEGVDELHLLNITVAPAAQGKRAQHGHSQHHARDDGELLPFRHGGIVLSGGPVQRSERPASASSAASDLW